MSRALRESQFVSVLPEAAVALAGLVTQFGDMWFVLVGITAVFTGHRAGLSLTDDPWRDCLFLVGLAVGSYSLTVVLKHAFALPRPPGAATATAPGWLPALAGPAYEAMVTGDGYGFPSGHALNTTVVYGVSAVALLALVLGRGLPLAGYPGREWLLFLAMAVGPGILGHTLVNWSLAHVESNLVSVTLLGEPVGSALFAFLLLAEVPGPWTVVGGSVVLAGIALTARGRPAPD